MWPHRAVPGAVLPVRLWAPHLITYKVGGTRVTVDEARQTVTTEFANGLSLTATPGDTSEDEARATALGYCDVWAMTREHDLLHALVSDALGLSHSPALHAVAAGEAMADPQMGDFEERIVLLLQRALNVGRQIIDERLTGEG